MTDAALREIDLALRNIFRGRRLARAHVQAAREAGVSLDPPGLFLLSRVAERPTRLMELAGRIGLDPSTISRKVQELEGAGLLTRQPDSDDRRAATLDVTPHGKEVVELAERGRLAFLEELLKNWSEGDRRELARLVGRLSDALGCEPGTKRCQP